MNKLNMHSPDLTQDYIAKVRELFPNCITEAQDETGRLRLAVDFDQLRQELSDHIVDGPQERYRLDWPGKRAATVAANAPIAKTLRPARDESIDFDTTENLFIEGDNLDALKLLQETYLGKVKMIYIDPPYNTGKDFVYSDKFAQTTQEYLERSNQVGEDGKLVANADSNGRYHSDWLNMMYPRLKLARNLLRDDGVIFISIDDNESANLKRICDEVFGRDSFKSDISWQKRYTRSNNTQDFTTVVEHIFVYARSEKFIVNLLPRTADADNRYTNPDNDFRGPWKGASFLNPASPGQRPNLCYPIENPNTKTVTEPTSNAWRRSKEEFKRLQDEGLLYWGINGDALVPSIKMFLSEARGLTPINLWEHAYAGNTDNGTNDVASLLNGKYFDNPKPVKLIKRVLQHSTDLNSIVLDFFAGSSTTAHAVMKLNAEDGGNRKFIMVQLPEETGKKTEAFKAGYKNIAELSKERIRRAGKKILEGGCHEDWKKDVGFRVLKVDSSNMKDVFYRPDEVSQQDLVAAIDNVKDERTSEDLLFQVLVDWGVDLTLPIRREQLQGKEVYFVDDSALIACFDKGVSETLVKELAGHKPLRMLFRDSGFASDAAKINVTQIFKQLSPDTDVRTL